MSSNVKGIIEAWTQFDIKTIQHDLDNKVIEIAQKLEEGDASRKSLIEKTKEFRKGLTEDQRKLIGPMFKQFQQEVDGSTKRSKFMEQILLSLYKQIIDLPDPNPVLESAQLKLKKAEKMQDIEIENKQLKATLDDYHQEFAQVKNQEVTIKSLKEKIKELETLNEQNIQQKLKEKEKELQRFFTEKEEQLQDNHQDLMKKLTDAENRNVNVTEQLEKYKNELFEVKQKQDELLNAKMSEMDILLQDIDKLTERAANAERLVEQYENNSAKLNQDINDTKSLEASQQYLNDMKINNFRTSSLEIELAAKEKEISQLVEDVQKLHLKSNKSRELYENQREKLEERLLTREKNLKELEDQLLMKKDYDEIKRELDILKIIEFNTLKDENKIESVTTENSNQPLEILLLDKNRQLQNENTQVKNKLDELTFDLDRVTKEESFLKKTNAELNKLVKELEKDLDNVASNQKDSLSSAHSTILNLDNQDDTVDNNNTSLFQIVSNQRERFKVKCHELEAENIASKQQVIFFSNELDQLRSDNVKLYEKIRYLQSAERKTHKYKQSDVDLDSNSRNDDTVLNKYTNDYEKKLDPFSKFGYQEKQRSYANLKLHDKFTLSLGRFILSNKTSRLIFCGYFLIIHLLIFLNLYHLAHNESTHRDLSVECAQAYKNHMFEVHGNTKFSPPH